MDVSQKLNELRRRWFEESAKGNALSAEELCLEFPDLLPILREQMKKWQSEHTTKADAESAKLPSLSFSTSMSESLTGAAWPDLHDRYEMKEKIAEGGMGEVWRAFDTELGRAVAIKILKQMFVKDHKMKLRFAEEARIMSQLQQHPGIPPVHSVGKLTDDRPFYAMKLIKGQKLSEILNGRTDPMADLPKILEVFEQVCRAMAFAHSRWVVHRDIKPSNIMVGAFGEVHIMDWGLAKVLDSNSDHQSPADEEISAIMTLRAGETDHATEAGEIMGTIRYMSPEQAQGAIEHLDQRADVFALGAMLCQILTGEPPYICDDRQELHRQAIAGDLHDAIERLEHCEAESDLIFWAKKCLEPGKGNRPRDAGELADGIASYRVKTHERDRRAELDRFAQETEAEKSKRIDVERAKRRLAKALSMAVVLVLIVFIVAIQINLQRLEAERAREKDVSDIQHKMDVLRKSHKAKMATLVELHNQMVEKLPHGPERERRVIENINPGIKELDHTKIGEQVLRGRFTGCFFNLHIVKLSANKVYLIDMRGQGFATHILLRSSNGRTVGYGSNLPIKFTPKKTDTYRIVASTIDWTVFGDYSLYVTELAPKK